MLAGATVEVVDGNGGEVLLGDDGVVVGRFGALVASWVVAACRHDCKPSVHVCSKLESPLPNSIYR